VAVGGNWAREAWSNSTGWCVPEAGRIRITDRVLFGQVAARNLASHVAKEELPSFL
jgi:hypothetical protein